MANTVILPPYSDKITYQWHYSPHLALTEAARNEDITISTTENGTAKDATYQILHNKLTKIIEEQHIG